MMRGAMVAAACALLAACSGEQAAQTQSTVSSQTQKTFGEMNRAAQNVATADTQLKVRVAAAIAAQAGVNVFHVSTDVKDGVVTLRGRVPSTSVEQTIVKTAAGVSGVKRVVNQLTV